MSYTIFIQKFKGGEPSNFELSELVKIVSKHGEIVDNEFGIEIESKKDLFEYASLGKSKSDIDGISIHRPNNNDALKELIFEILQIQGACFFDQELSFLQTRTLDLKEFPEDLIENSLNGIELIESLKQIWPKSELE